MADDAPPRGRGLREGFSTGACAAAAARAAAEGLFAGRPVETVTIWLPVGRHATFTVSDARVDGTEAVASVVKDAGDDPDCTHGAEITAAVRATAAPGVVVTGGAGVARVTRPGLGIEVGQAAITRVPLRMITDEVAGALAAAGRAVGAVVEIRVPRGEEMARKTLNHRLGLVGGISILGTNGIVRPYSTAAYKVSICNSIDVAVAAGLGEVVLTTGGKSEEYAQQVWALPEQAFVQMGDWVGFTLGYCRKRGVGKVDIAGMIGKLSKVAAGELYTHARQSAVDLEGLAAVAVASGAGPDVAARIRAGNTAREAQEIVLAAGVTGFFDRLAAQAAANCRAHGGGTFAVETVLVDADGVVLGRGVAA